MATNATDPEVEDTSGEEEERSTADDHKKLRKNARTRLTKLQTAIKKHIDSKGKCAVLLAHRANLCDLVDECLVHHSNYVNKAGPTGEEFAKAEKWAADLDASWTKWAAYIDSYIGDQDAPIIEQATGESDSQDQTANQGGAQVPDDDNAAGNPFRPPLRKHLHFSPVDDVSIIEQQIQSRKRKLAAELEDSQLKEARRVEDIRRRAKREEDELEDRLAAARARNPLSSTPHKNHAGYSGSTSRSYIDVTTQGTAVTSRLVDGWIYKPFEAIVPGSENQTVVTMAMLPNLKPFGGDPREWPMFIQNFKNMVHDMFSSDAHRLTLLHSMLDSKLRGGMSQILTSPMAYRNALQELRRKYGHPHLVVRTYIQGLMELPLVRAETIETFSSHLHGAVSTLDSAGYGHELDSSVALEGILGKLPESMVDRWGRHVNRLLPNIPTLRHLDAWLEEEVMSRKNVRPMTFTPTTGQQQNKGAQQQQNKGSFFKPPNLFPTINTIEDSPSEKCSICNTEPWHRLTWCPKFIGLTPTERAQTIYDLRNCFRCLGRKHNSKECKKVDQKCGVASCNGKHHTLLHGADTIATLRRPPSKP